MFLLISCLKNLFNKVKNKLKIEPLEVFTFIRASEIAHLDNLIKNLHLGMSQSPAAPWLTALLLTEEGLQAENIAEFMYRRNSYCATTAKDFA